MDPSRAKTIAGELQISRSSVRVPAHFHGTSMEPLFVEGDELVVEPILWDSITVGDIVTYRYEDKFPTRRVIAKRGDALVFACDNWPTVRFEAHRDDILGRAVARRRDGCWLREGDDEWRRTARRALRRASREIPLLALRSLRHLLSRLRRRVSGSAAC